MGVAEAQPHVSDLPSVSSDGFAVVDSWMLRGEIRDKQTRGVDIK